MIPVTSPPIDTPLPLFLESEIPANIIATIPKIKPIPTQQVTIDKIPIISDTIAIVPAPVSCGCTLPNGC